MVDVAEATEELEITEEVQRHVAKKHKELAEKNRLDLIGCHSPKLTSFPDLLCIVFGFGMMCSHDSVASGVR